MLADEMIRVEILTAMGGPLKFYIILYRFLSSVVAQITSILPEKLHYLCNWGGVAAPLPPTPCPACTPMVIECIPTELQILAKGPHINVGI